MSWGLEPPRLIGSTAHYLAAGMDDKALRDVQTLAAADIQVVLRVDAVVLPQSIGPCLQTRMNQYESVFSGLSPKPRLWTRRDLGDSFSIFPSIPPQLVNPNQRTPNLTT